MKQEESSAVAQLLKPAYRRGDDMKRVLLGACDPMSGADVAARLGITLEFVDELRARRQIIAVPVQHEWIYPGVQFAGSSLLEHVQELLRELECSSWTALAFLLCESRDLDGRTPLQVLKSGSLQDRERVFRMARILAGDGFG